MSRVSILKYVFNTARAGLVFVGMLSPAHAAYQHDAVSVFPDLPKTAVSHRFLSGADCSPALACSDRPSATAPGTRPAFGGGVIMGAAATAA
jgi:hypothetical protein